MIGVILVVAGIALVHVPSAIMASGVFLIAGALFIDLDRMVGENEASRQSKRL